MLHFSILSPGQRPGLLSLRHFFTHHHLRASVDDDNLMKLSCLDGRSDHLALSISAYLCLGVLGELLDVGVRIFRLGILELHDVRVSHVAIDVEKRTEEDVSIPLLRVLLGDRTIELVLASHG